MGETRHAAEASQFGNGIADAEYRGLETGWSHILGGGNSNISLCSPLFGEDEPILTIIFFQMGWFNHQLVFVCCFFHYIMVIPSWWFRNPANKPVGMGSCFPIIYMFFSDTSQVGGWPDGISGCHQ